MCESYAEARILREQMGYSIGNMARLIGLKKPTYQGYDNGKRPTPPDIIEKLELQRQKDLDFMAGMSKRFEDYAKKDGLGYLIPSEITGDDDESDL